ncbi:DUF1146 family protein [Alteribacter populi]|uniref:DUF1146 family protein n=1 Tax=Alteribacter populi TaxID=2011011 RepID=UPI001E57DEA1|nr:DUF1146 family protein [Alteribacter populi]
MEHFGQQALVSIFVNLVVLVTVWWSLQTFKWDLFVNDADGPKAKALVILVAVAITHLVSSFLLNYFNWSTMLRHLF